MLIDKDWIAVQDQPVLRNFADKDLETEFLVKAARQSPVHFAGTDVVHAK